jgi:hypothetical protein
MPFTVLCGGDWRVCITFAYSEKEFTSIGATSPFAIRRFVASPDADTPSYSVPPP